jgi:GT2 family glycosyltransferase
MEKIRLSICIVNYEAKKYLRECLLSLFENTNVSFEVIVVDNGSQDSTLEMLKEEFPEVRTIENEINLGYTRPMNQALYAANGHYLIQLNPDTLILSDALDILVEFMDSSYFIGLGKLFPKSKLFGGYLMSYMDEDKVHPVAGVSGSCMLTRREVIDQIGYLDERYFAYQEDADFCFRARQAGWYVFYFPNAEIIHFGGSGGSHVQPRRSIIEWHRSYFRYYQKNLAENYFPLLNWIYYSLMAVKLTLSLLINAIRTILTDNSPRLKDSIKGSD